MFDWRDYLALANDLSSGARGTLVQIQMSEATSRCAVSRAYYAAFCHARNYASAYLGFVPTNTGADHWMLRPHLERPGRKDVANRLRRLHTWRKQCDYDNAVVHLATTVSNALREATDVIQRL
jgi:hypothetical protein